MELSITEAVPVLRLLIHRAFWAALVALGVSCAGAYPSWRLGGREGLEAMALAGVICVVVAVTSLVPVVVAVVRQADWLGQACLAGTTVRMLVTVAAGVVCYVVMRPATFAYAMWMVVFYLVLLAWETVWVSGIIKAKYATNSPSSGLAEAAGS